jgi:protein-S-isoprenylcysteine O-methyltransferase Ste14
MQEKYRLLLRSASGSVYGLLAFLGAGRFDWWRGWIYFLLFLAVSVAGSWVVHRASPGLIEARAKGIRKDTKPFDKLFFAMFAPLILFYPVLAGMDAVRFTWGSMPFWTVYPGVVLFCFGSAVSTWTMIVNRNAETTVRIQKDRGHKVISDGPYRFVRHPMYASIIVGLPATALILGSVWATVPMALIMVLFVWRTTREDIALQEELEGYEAYVKATRYRLLPHVW